jgi:hypothetical protein
MTLKSAADFRPTSIAVSLLPFLFVLDIERDAARAAPQLRIRLIGTAIDGVFRRPLRGHTLEEYIHGPRGADVMASFHLCADTRKPIWMRQVVHVGQNVPRYVEGVAVYLESDRIYGGLVVGEAAGSSSGSFERVFLSHGVPTA